MFCPPNVRDMSADHADTMSAPVRPGSAGSDSTRTQVQESAATTPQVDSAAPLKPELHGGEGESAIPEDRQVGGASLLRALQEW